MPVIAYLVNVELGSVMGAAHVDPGALDDATRRSLQVLTMLGNGFVIYRDGSMAPVHTSAGWTQLALPVTPRLTFNLFGGMESDQPTYAVSRNFSYAANALYHLGPNVVFGVEALQSRLRYYNGAYRIVNHYDLALAYVF